MVLCTQNVLKHQHKIYKLLGWWDAADDFWRVGDCRIGGTSYIPNKKKKKRHNDIKYLSPKLLCNIQNCFGCHISMYRYERSTKTMQVILTWHLLKSKDMGYSQQLILSSIWPYLKRVAWNSKFIWKIVIPKSTSNVA